MSGRNQYHFFCTPCSAVICEDCRLLGEESLELATNRGIALHETQQQIKELKEELAIAIRRADDFEGIMKLGQHKVLLAWMNSLPSAELLKKVEEAK